jgi:hypothetical protein
MLYDTSYTNEATKAAHAEATKAAHAEATNVSRGKALGRSTADRVAPGILCALVRDQGG